MCWQTQKYLHIPKAHKHQSDGMEQDKGLHTTLCTAAAGIFPDCQGKRRWDSFWVMGISYHPSYSKTSSSVPVAVRGRGEGKRMEKLKNPVHPVFLLSLHTLPHQGYHKHYTKSSNDCTKNKGNHDQQKQKAKPHNQTSGNSSLPLQIALDI